MQRLAGRDLQIQTYDILTCIKPKFHGASNGEIGSDFARRTFELQHVGLLGQIWREVRLQHYVYQKTAQNPYITNLKSKNILGTFNHVKAFVELV